MVSEMSDDHKAGLMSNNFMNFLTEAEVSHA